MCGFAGFIDAPSAQQEQRRILQGMGRQLARRGPDDQQVIIRPHIGFVFRRLSIVDPETGRQPIWNEDNTLFTAVNGEIYNHLELREKLNPGHCFKTKSDSEIVLHLYEEYGPGMLKWLNGMFAIAIWDTRREELFIARDRFGIKPLYYVKQNQNTAPFLFGSEIKTLLAHPACPREICWEDVSVAQGYRASRLTSFIEGIDQLPGGYYATYSEGRFQKFQYWSLEEYLHRGPDTSKTSAAFQEEYTALLEESVKMHLMSDAPLGSFLSGGLDSAVITAIAARQNPDYHCFNIVEPTARSSGDTERALGVAEYLGISLHQVLIDYDRLLRQLDFSLETFEYYTWMIEAPLFDLEWIFKHELHRFARTVEPRLKVILVGQGADEFAGGYSNPYDAPRPGWESYLEFLAQRQQKEMLKRIGMPPSLMELSSGGVYTERQEMPSHQDSLSFFQKEMLQRILSLQFHNLRHEDRTGAAQGIEVRVPFLDYRLVELLASIPPTLHPKLFWDKRIIRDAGKQ
ncbi:MAG: hypothetical protein QG657_3802, partial [Acidobacteriota bacterium]|nr:hypothetical protein [Acidobacteriota bacterium]